MDDWSESGPLFERTSGRVGGRLFNWTWMFRWRSRLDALIDWWFSEVSAALPAHLLHVCVGFPTVPHSSCSCERLLHPATKHYYSSGCPQACLLINTLRLHACVWIWFVSTRVLTDVRGVSQAGGSPHSQLLQSEALNIPFYHRKWQISHPSASLKGTAFILMQFQCFLISALSRGMKTWGLKGI